MPVVAPFGFYGSGNIGDEATLQGFARLLGARQERLRAWVASQDTRHTSRVEPSLRYYRQHLGRRRYLTSWIRRLASAYVFPGGTPIMDGLGSWPLTEVSSIVSHARRLGKPVVFVGTGTERLQRPESHQIVTEVLADYVTHWSVRSSRDWDRLVALKVPQDRITVAADMAWLIPRASPDFGRRILQEQGLIGRRLVAVNVNGETELLEREPRLFEKLAAFLDRLVEDRGLSVLFVCNEIREGATFDQAAAAAVKAHMRHKEVAFDLPTLYWAPQEMMSIIAACELAVSTRYHFCLFAALQGVPFLPIKRSDKVRDLCEDIEWPFGAVPGSVDSDRLALEATRLIDDPAPDLRKLSGCVAVMAERARRNHVAVDAMLKCIGAAPRHRSWWPASLRRAPIA